MGLSSESLIHQTSFENLISILESSSIGLSYCKEVFGSFKRTSNTSGGSVYTHVFPMICLSEIPFSSLQNHLGRYGNCILGMKKNWAISNKFSPVHYCHDESHSAEKLINSYWNLSNSTLPYLDIEKKNPTLLLHIKLLRTLEYQLAYTKNYNGEVNSRNYQDKNYYFSEEREWRYVPTNEELGTELISLHPDSFEDNKEAAQSKLKDHGTSFTHNDISFIVVDSDEERASLIKRLLEFAPDSTINIFTNNEILSDFFGYKNPSMKSWKMNQENLALKKQLDEKEGKITGNDQS